jgi:hypothetical protein
MRWVAIAVVTILVACGGGSDDALSNDEYRSETTTAFDRADMDTVIARLTDASNEAALTLNDDWKQETLDALKTWHEPLDMIEGLNAPDDADAAEDAALNAAECLSDTADQLEDRVEAESIATFDFAPLMTSCLSMLQTWAEEMDGLPDD